jgi:hypothetical protein
MTNLYPAPPDYEWPIADGEPGCVVCGVAVPAGETYCGASCERMDEESDYEYGC